MGRSSKKGPYVHPKLLEKILEMNKNNEHRVIRTWSRSSMIIPEMIGIQLRFITVENMSLYI